MISHDREFMQALCTETWLVEDGEVRGEKPGRRGGEGLLLLLSLGWWLGLVWWS